MACACGLEKQTVAKTIERRPSKPIRSVIRKTGRRIATRPMR